MAADSEKIRGLFARAIEIDSEQERNRFLDQIGQGDPALRQELEQLLHAFFQAGDFLKSEELSDASKAETQTFAGSVESCEDTFVGPYHLLQKIGEGGMGVVYMAQQVEPVRRRVAVKLIRPELGNRRVLARFEAERQALALMDHPNIAKVLDAGTTENQVPYFVMEMVKGVPITQYCDEHCLSLRERLALMIPIANAVQHAHQKGIIHRDLKPSNILVAEYDDRPVPKIIDFGIAKALDSSLTNDTVFTSFDQIIGTLEYMSPEQAKFNQLDIDTRSDIYSLGVVLYELLTGTTPFAAEKLRARALDELLRMIREQDPEVPSLRLRNSGSLPSLAALRHVPPARLTVLVRGELDWITMRALEKDRARRYESATEFGRDIERYMNDQTVAACPPSLTYRVKKFVRRNRGVVLSSCAIALAVAIGGVMSIRANTVTRSAYNEVQTARSEAETQADNAKKSKEQAEQAVWDFFMVVSESPELTKLPGTQKLRRKLVGTARDYYENVLEDSAFWNEYNRGLVWNRLGMMEDDLGNLDEALPAYEKSLEHWQLLQEQDPDNREYANNVGSSKILIARTHAYLGRLRKAEEIAEEILPSIERWVAEFPDYVEHQKCLAWLHNLFGLIYLRTDETQKASEHFRASVDIAKNCLNANPEDIMVLDRIAGDLHNLSVLEYRQRLLDEAYGHSKDAEKYHAMTSELLDGQQDISFLAALESIQGKIFTEKGDLITAMEMHQSALQRCDQLARRNPDVPEHREGKAKSHNSLGVINDRLGRSRDALTEYELAISIREPLVSKFPEISVYARELIKNYLNAAAIHLTLGSGERSLLFAKKAVSLAEDLEDRDGATPEHENLLASCYVELGKSLAADMQADAASQTFTRGLELYQRLAAKEPDLAEYHIDYADALSATSKAWLKWGDAAKAKSFLLDAFEQYKPYLSGKSADFRAQGNAVLALFDLAILEDADGNLEETLAHYERATEIARFVYSQRSARPQVRALLIGCLVNQGLVWDRKGNLDSAVALISEAYQKALELHAEIQQSETVESYLANSRTNLAMLRVKQQKVESAVQLYREIIAMPERTDTRIRQLRLSAHQELAGVLDRQGKAQEAAVHYNAASELAELLLGGEDPIQPSRGTETAFHALATYLSKQGKASEARPVFNRAIKLCEQMKENEATSPSLTHFAALCVEAAENAVSIDREESYELFQRGIAAYELALRLKPESLSLLRSLGRAHSAIVKVLPGGRDGAFKQYARSLETCRKAFEHADATDNDLVDLVRCYTNCAITLAEQGEIEEAILFYEDAISCGEDKASDDSRASNFRIPALINLGRILRKGPQSDKAKVHFEHALRLGLARIEAGEVSPRVHIETAFARVNIAESYSVRGESVRALEDIQIAREQLHNALKKNQMWSYAQGFLSLAMNVERQCVNQALGKPDGDERKMDAIVKRLKSANEWLQQNVGIWPNGHPTSTLLKNQFAYLSNSLAWRLATDATASNRNGVSAVIYATDANRVSNYRSWSYLDTLAAAYAEAGQFESAVAWQEKAAELAPAEYQAELSDRRELYLKKQAYRDDQEKGEPAQVPPEPAITE